MTEEQPYTHVTFCWWKAVDVSELAEKLGTRFTIVRRPRSEEGATEVSIYKTGRSELIIRADTLTAFLSGFRAVLSQKEKAPFTEKDLELRTTVLELYPRTRPTPFPWQSSKEPKFEIEKSND